MAFRCSPVLPRWLHLAGWPVLQVCVTVSVLRWGCRCLFSRRGISGGCTQQSDSRICGGADEAARLGFNLDRWPGAIHGMGVGAGWQPSTLPGMLPWWQWLWALFERVFGITEQHAAYWMLQSLPEPSPELPLFWSEAQSEWCLPMH